ncbi:MAG TPA: hypothetical protein VJ489_00410 [Thermoplasmata archaeon]|nr:hypothetical protein [Thermoplasmata archaeon]
MSENEVNKDFALLVGRAFLHELEVGHKESAVAFGRAFLLALGMRGPEETAKGHYADHKANGNHIAVAEN